MQKQSTTEYHFVNVLLKFQLVGDGFSIWLKQTKEEYLQRESYITKRWKSARGLFVFENGNRKFIYQDEK